MSRGARADTEEEILLEPVCLRHAPDFRRIAMDPEVAAPAGLDVPLRATWAESFCAWRASAFREPEALTFAMLYRNIIVGCVGIHDLDVRAGTGEFAIWLARTYWGRSIASAAARAVLQIGFEQLGLHRVRARCAERNHRALALLRRVGFRLDVASNANADQLRHLSVTASIDVHTRSSATRTAARLVNTATSPHATWLW